jgi:MFS family permease
MFLDVIFTCTRRDVHIIRYIFMMAPRQEQQQYASEGSLESQQSEGTPLLGKKGHDSSAKQSCPSLPPSPTHPPSKASPWPPKATIALAFTMLTQSFLLTGVFPYAGFLAMHLIPSLDTESAGRYAGLVGSSFMFGRIFTSYAWGKAADRHGRTFVIKASLMLSAFFSVAFGLAPTLPLALAARFAMGLSNCLLGMVQTVVTELTKGDKSAETRDMGIVLGALHYGFLLNPALAGYLADPLMQYPSSRLVEVLDGILDLEAFPFLLPNLVGSVYCIVAYVLVWAFVEETLPADQIEPFFEPKWKTKWGLKHGTSVFDPPISLHNVSEAEDQEDVNQYGATSGVSLCIVPSKEVEVLHGEKLIKGKEKSTATIKSLLARTSTRKHLIMYWTFSFLSISIDETFPLYCMSKDSGLGVTEKMIGNLLSGAGSVFLVLQFLLLTNLVERYGLYKAMRIGALFSVPLVCFIPLTLVTNRVAAAGTLTWSTLGLTSVIYALARAFAAVTFSTIAMTTNRTVPAHQRATMNGLSMLGGSVVKATGPVWAGVLFSESVGRIVKPYGAVFAWAVISCLGLGFVVMTMLLPEHVEEEEEEEECSDDDQMIEGKGV